MPSKSVSDVAVSGSTLIAAQRPTGSIISRVTDPIVMIRPAQSALRRAFLFQARGSNGIAGYQVA